jgi:XRE family transcriptional regulator, regulator of sulfur utilization
VHSHLDSTRHDLGRVLRALRKQQAGRVTLEELGRRAGLHDTYIGDIERGERNPSFESLNKILSGLDVTWEEFGRQLDGAMRRSDG